MRKMKLPIVMGWKGYDNLTGDPGGLDIFTRKRYRCDDLYLHRDLLFLRPSRFSLWLFNWFARRFPL